MKNKTNNNKNYKSNSPRIKINSNENKYINNDYNVTSKEEENKDHVWLPAAALSSGSSASSFL